MVVLPNSSKTPISSLKFFSIFIVAGLQSFLRLSCFLRFHCFNFSQFVLFMIFKVQFPVMRRYLYVLKSKADNLIDVFGEEATNQICICGTEILRTVDRTYKFFCIYLSESITV